MTFEESLKKLNDIVSQLESGKLSLDESLDIYKEGTQIAVNCKKSLENAKLQVKALSQDVLEDS